MTDGRPRFAPPPPLPPPSPLGNRWQVPPSHAAQRRSDRPVDQTRPRPQDL